MSSSQKMANAMSVSRYDFLAETGCWLTHHLNDEELLRETRRVLFRDAGARLWEQQAELLRLICDDLKTEHQGRDIQTRAVTDD